MTRSITSRIDAITRIDDTYRAEKPPCPRSVKIELTARCNFACAYCARSQRLRQQKDMKRSLYQRLAKEMRQAGVEELGLFYLGESFLLKWLPEAVAYAKQEVGFPYVFLTTNGSLATPDRVSACMEAGLDSLKFSLNYSDAEQFSDVAGVKPELFAKVIDNLREARRVRDAGGFDCGIYASYILYDGEQRERMAALVEEVTPYVDEIYALPLYNQADLAAERETEMAWTIAAGNPGRVGALRDPLPCWALFTEGHITWDGMLSACCFDHDGRFHMGNLNETSFLEAWQSEIFQSLRAAHLVKDVRNTVCESCVAYA
jgi:radical SAM protein with 4Fe4S-binding SPASM domain